MEAMKQYDAIIIGGGGGLKLRPISNMGKKVAIIEREDLGGTCLNRGCIPSKMLIHPADMIQELKEFKKHNMSVDENVEVDFEALVKRVNESVGGTSKSIAEAYARNPNVDFYHAEASFVSDKVVAVDGEEITAERIFIATGSRPAVPPIEGLEGTPFMTSREALRNTKLPKKMIVIGGGYIAMELGYFYSAMGVEVHYIVRSGVLSHEDGEIVEEFLRAFDHGEVHLGLSTKRVEFVDGEFTVHVESKEGEAQEFSGDALFVATGIQPNTEALKLENTGVKVNERGFIEVDDHLETDVSGIYALGDVVGNYFFRHSVNFEGEYLLRTLYEDPSDEPIDYPAMPHAVFSHPQIAGVGKTEEQLKEEAVPYLKGVNAYKNSAFGGDVLQSEHGLVKLLFHAETQVLLGAHIVGREASSMIHMCIPFINQGATLKDMQRTIYIHPAFPEVIRNAARKAS